MTRPELYAVLSTTAHALQSGQVPQAMERLFAGLEEIRKSVSPDEWTRLVAIGQAHPLCHLLRQCPLTDHALRRPRGYPGDAELIDYIYFGIDPNYQLSPHTSQLGQAVFRWLVQTPAAEAVRMRREFIAREIERFATQSPRRILSIAAGHCRELQSCQAFLLHSGTTLVALDQDRASLDHIHRTYGNGRIRTECVTVRDLAKPDVLSEEFDLIYALGLYDYLPDDFARRLTASLFARLNVGGKLVVANFAPGLDARGFMEMYLRWDLIYRDCSTMSFLWNDIPQHAVAENRIYPIAAGALLCLDLVRSE